MATSLNALEPRFQMLGPLGSGATSHVYRALDTALQREVAVKVLAVHSADARARFVREAQAAAQLRHPNIVTIFDVIAAADELYIVQELLRGRTLEALMAAGVRIPVADAVDLLVQLASALHAAHALGIIHRDFKPANIFVLSEGRAKLLDFGIAKAPNQSSLTQVGFVGTPAYSSPEQLRGDIVDLRSDIFSFGVVAFEMLTGQRLFDAPSIPATVHQVMYAAIPDIADIAPDLPADVHAVVIACLRREVAQRPDGMSEILAQLREAALRAGALSPDDWLPHVLTPQDQSPVGLTAVEVVTNGQRPLSPTAPPPPMADTLEPQYDRGMGTVIGPVLPPVNDTLYGRSPSSSSATEVRWRAGRERPNDVLPDGTRVGKFTIHELVAPGQTGHLYKAFDPVRSRLIGLKVIQDSHGTAVTRLLRASRIWVDLHHPNLQRILEVGLGDASTPAYIATDLIEGVDLRTLLARRQLSLAQRLEVVLQLSDALDYLHDRGIVHREVTPRNVVISDSPLHVTLLDSGLARHAGADSQNVTVTGVVVGDLEYMAPEQLESRHDQRSDVYSVGVLLYELVVGKRFVPAHGAGGARQGANTTEMLRNELTKLGGVPTKLVSALVTALQPDPNRRFGSARELADALRPLVPRTLPPLDLSSVVVTLHGIRTHARWQRTFSEVASRHELHCKLDRWNFGYFSIVQFVSPWSRQAKVSWFRGIYHDEFGDQATSLLSTERPSIVAHSFGTYILGNALLRYPYIRFNKVLLCGSILPADFPWDALIERGQVQSVRNEFGARDVWTQAAPWFVAGTGSSGQNGFRRTHERLEQERFDYSHSEYFERGHMSGNWLPFLKRRLSHITPHDLDVPIARGSHPLGVYAAYVVLATMILVSVALL
jgi:serine/threonine protein kinase